MHHPLSNHEPAMEPGREVVSLSCTRMSWRCCTEWPRLETARCLATAAWHEKVRDVHPTALYTVMGTEDPLPLTVAG